MIDPYECEHCHKPFLRRRNNNVNRFCSRECAFAELRENRKGKSCSIWYAHCRICGKAFVARRRNQKFCRTRPCDLQRARGLAFARYRAKERPRCVCVKCRKSFYPEPGSHNRRYCRAHYHARISCSHCGGLIPVLLRRHGRRRTCSDECLAARLAEFGTGGTAQRQCEVCGEPFRKRSDKPTNIFCSQECKAARLKEIGHVALRMRFLACRSVALNHAGNH